MCCMHTYTYMYLHIHATGQPILKARHLCDSAFWHRFSRPEEVPKQSLDGIPLGLGLVMKLISYYMSPSMQCTCTGTCTCDCLYLPWYGHWEGYHVALVQELEESHHLTLHVVDFPLWHAAHTPHGVLRQVHGQKVAVWRILHNLKVANLSVTLQKEKKLKMAQTGIFLEVHVRGGKLGFLKIQGGLYLVPI